MPTRDRVDIVKQLIENCCSNNYVFNDVIFNTLLAVQDRDRNLAFELISHTIDCYKNKGCNLKDILVPILSHSYILQNEDLIIGLIHHVINSCFPEGSLSFALDYFIASMNRIEVKNQARNFNLTLSFIRRCYSSDMNLQQKIECTQKIIETVQNKNTTMLCATIFNLVNEFKEDKEILKYVSNIADKSEEKGNSELSSSIYNYAIASLYSIGKNKTDILEYAKSIEEKHKTTLNTAIEKVSKLVEDKSQSEINTNQLLLDLLSQEASAQLLASLKGANKKMGEQKNQTVTHL